MSNIDNRMQKFYNRGYITAIDDINVFMNSIGDRFSYLKFNNKITATEFLSALMTQFNKLYVNEINSKQMEDINGK